MPGSRKKFFFVFCAILGLFLLACAAGGFWALADLADLAPTRSG